MRNIRIYLFLLTLFCQCFQGLKGQSYFFRISDDSITDIRFYSDSVRIISQGSIILYLDSTGFLSSAPASISKALQTEFNLTLRNGGVQIDKNIRYKTLYKGISIRHIGENFVGTYQGVFNGKKKFSELTYSNGTILESGDSVLVAWDGFTIFHEDNIYDYTQRDSSFTYVQGKNIGYSRSSCMLGNSILLLTTKGIYSLNVITKELITILEEDNDMIQHFSDEIDFRGKKISVVIGLNSKKLRVFEDGSYSVLEQYDSKITYYNAEQDILLLQDRFKDVSLNKTFQVKNTYHSVFKVNKVYFGSSDEGLFAFVDQYKPLKLSEHEYNARSFRISNDTVFLGSVSGLFAYPFNYLTKQIAEIREADIQPTNYTLLGLIILGSMVIIGFIVLLLIMNKRLSQTRVYEASKEITHSILVEYISQNIKDVSIASLCEEFNLNQKDLYAFFPGSSPGMVMRQLRLEKAKNLFNEGKSTEIIAVETGYSKKYLSQTILPQLNKK
jgi:AraC-like DNA-binding protein